MDSQVQPSRQGGALGHPLRVALLDLLSRRPTLTSTEAARELGESSGACSFHLRQLERYGRVEEVPGQHGRVRPWRLVAQVPRDRVGAGSAGGVRAGGSRGGGAGTGGSRGGGGRNGAARGGAGPSGAGSSGAGPGGAGPADGRLSKVGVSEAELAGVERHDDQFGELATELENEGYRRWLAGRETAPSGWRDDAFSAVVYLTPAELAKVAAAIRAIVAPYAEREEGQAAMPVGVVARIFPLLPAGSDD